MAEIKQRGFLAPLIEYDDGTVGMGVPGLLYQPYQALARLMQHGYNPRAVAQVEGAKQAAQSDDDNALIEILRKYGLLGALGLGAATQTEGDG